MNVTLERKGDRFKLTALFVVGWDGAHTAVRHLLNLPFEGAQYDMSFMLTDVETNEVQPGDQMQLCPSEFSPLPIFPMSFIRRRIVAAEAFVRIHRSYIVNPARPVIVTLPNRQCVLEMASGERLPSGRTYGKKIRTLLTNPF